MLKERMNNPNIIIKPTGTEKKVFSESDLKTYEMIKNMLFGLAIGDAVGVPHEFKTREELESNPVTDMVGFGTYNMPVGTWSDDTSLTLALMDSIAENDGVCIKDIGEKFLEWYEEGKYTATGVMFDCGKTTMESLERIKDSSFSENGYMVGGKNINDNGNGALMRILPLAFYFYCNHIDNVYKRMFSVCNVSKMTHAHKISQNVCFDYIEILLQLMSGKELKNTKTYTGLNYMKDEKPDKNNAFVEVTLESAYWCINNSFSYKEAILKAVNLGYDTDTVAAVTGSMAGLLWGIPEDWYAKLLNKELIYKILMKFSDRFLG